MKWILLIVGVLLAGAAFIAYKNAQFDWRAEQSRTSAHFLEDCPENEIRLVAVSPRSNFFVSELIDLKRGVYSMNMDGAVSHITGGYPPLTPENLARIESLRRALPEATKPGSESYDFEDNLYLAFWEGSSLKIYCYPLRPLPHALHDFLAASNSGADQDFPTGL